MSQILRDNIVKKSQIQPKNPTVPELLQKFNLKTTKENQFVTFFKPEVFLEKTPEQTEKIIDKVFEKFTQFEVQIDGAGLFPGPALEKFSIMDRHYGAINYLSKNASKVLSDEDRKKVHHDLKILDKELEILGGHEAFAIAGVPNTSDFDRYWLEKPSTKIRSGFYVRPMIIANKEVIVVNGFHPHQLAHYNSSGRYLGVLLISSDTSWKTVREQMLGDVFPEKAVSDSIRGTFYAQASNYGFKKVTIANNILHISAGPTEALFEIDNFLREPFGIDILKDGAVLAEKLKKAGVSDQKIKNVLTNINLHSRLEHKDTDEAVREITNSQTSPSL